MINAAVIALALLAVCGCVSGSMFYDGGEEMDSKIEGMIRENSIGAKSDRAMEIQETTGSAPYTIPGIRFFSSAYMFNIDPVPRDYWVFSDGNIERSGSLAEILKKKGIYPKSAEEALGIARLIVFSEDPSYEVYPAFEDKSGKLSKPSVEEKDGVYTVVMYVSKGNFGLFRLPQFMSVVECRFRLGKGVYGLVQEGVAGLGCPAKSLQPKNE